MKILVLASGNPFKQSVQLRRATGFLAEYKRNTFVFRANDSQNNWFFAVDIPKVNPNLVLIDLVRSPNDEKIIAKLNKFTFDEMTTYLVSDESDELEGFNLLRRAFTSVDHNKAAILLIAPELSGLVKDTFGMADYIVEPNDEAFLTASGFYKLCREKVKNHAVYKDEGGMSRKEFEALMLEMYEYEDEHHFAKEVYVV